MFIPCDYRIWEVFDTNNNSLGSFMYGDLILQYSPLQITKLSLAIDSIKNTGHSIKEIGNIYPLEELSNNPLVQKLKNKFIKKENKVLKNKKKSKGYKLKSIIEFGKYKGQMKTIQWIIDNDNSYFQWLISNKIILTHPEIDALSNIQL